MDDGGKLEKDMVLGLLADSDADSCRVLLTRMILLPRVVLMLCQMLIAVVLGSD
jgi:hypothetical protein